MLENLQNESDVEQYFIKPLLDELDYTQQYVETKKTIPITNIGKGRKQKSYTPDYILYLKTKKMKPVIVIDAKHTNEDANQGVVDSQLYASILRRRLSDPKPEQYCIGCNGKTTIIKHYDSNEEFMSLDFDDFHDGNKKYEKFKEFFSRKNFNDNTTTSSDRTNTFKFRKPPINELNGIFNACHRIIWKKEKISPTKAFYEFAKIMFIKLDEDRKISEKKIKEATIDDFIFSVNWIEKEESITSNPFDKLLFDEIRENLERQITDKKKKRIFNKNEKLNLKPSTIKEVVELLEHIDLHGVDEDLNGRMFETFLNATVRGKQLGQFFTPRTVVKFATKLVDLQVNTYKEKIDKMVDYCCGSGGFLIEAMTEMQNKIKSLPISNEQQKTLEDHIKTKCLFGADVNDIVTKIARMNMFLHSDGGSRIYQLADSLEKSIIVPQGIVKEHGDDIKELKKMFDEGLKFDVALTNPPFSMDYNSKDKDEWSILKEYELAYYGNKKQKHYKSVKSNVLFVERYHELLKNNGKLITVLDDGALCTRTGLRFREFVRKNFIIEALISLPKNTFVNADVLPSTSLLYLRKKNNPDEKESGIFVARCDNVGHTNSGKPILEKNQLPEILKTFEQYKQAPLNIPKKKFKVLQNNPLCFVIDPLLLEDEKRFDIYYYPKYYYMMQRLQKSKYEILPLSRFVKPINTGHAFKSKNFLSSGSIHLIRIRNIGSTGDLKYNKMVYVSEEIAEKNPDSKAKAGDLIMAMDGDDFRAITIPEKFNGVINQRIAIIRTNPDIDPKILMEYINKEFGQIQLERKKTKTTAGHITKKNIENIQIPNFVVNQKNILNVFANELSRAKKASTDANQQIDDAKNKIHELILNF